MPVLSLGRRALAATLAALLAVAPPAGAQLPTLGDSGDVTTSAERKLGESIARELYRDPDYIDDPVLVEYVQSLWQPLLAAARTRGELTSEMDERFAWQVLLGKDRTINAFALPGGWMGLNLGLVSITANRDELASVLAHELSHVTQRHISRLVTRGNQQAPWMLAAMILGAMAATRNPQAGGALMAGGQALAAQQQLNFSRDMEREADRIGFGVAGQAGFQPQGFVTMFEKLQQAARLNDNGNYPYLRTHPMTSERIADMQSRQQLADHKPVQPTAEHALMAGRARVFSNPGVDALRAMVAEADASGFAALPRPRQLGILYAATLAASRLRDPAATRRLLARLDAAAASDTAAQRLARLLAGEIALAEGDAARVLRTVDVESKRRPELLLTAQAQIQTGKAGEAAQRLQTWVATQPRDAAAWQLLSSAYGAQGQSVRAVRADAEARVAQLDYTAALDRFKAAQDLVRKGAGGADYIEASIIDTRARQVESRLREQALER
ncbi:M48 family metalloprotease [Ramlibacter alkalitolerans]|uniref:M48 family metalloprotease n=1 Tax=Ramlibacter alkalitolerans TaxID=2039631 RepID=UPI0038B4C4B6